MQRARSWARADSHPTCLDLALTPTPEGAPMFQAVPAVQAVQSHAALLVTEGLGAREAGTRVGTFHAACVGQGVHGFAHHMSGPLPAHPCPPFGA